MKRECAKLGIVQIDELASTPQVPRREAPKLNSAVSALSAEEGNDMRASKILEQRSSGAVILDGKQLEAFSKSADCLHELRDIVTGREEMKVYKRKEKETALKMSDVIRATKAKPDGRPKAERLLDATQKVVSKGRLAMESTEHLEAFNEQIESVLSMLADLQEPPKPQKPPPSLASPAAAPTIPNSAVSSAAVGTENDGIMMVTVRKTNAAEELMKSYGIDPTNPVVPPAPPSSVLSPRDERRKLKDAKKKKKVEQMAVKKVEEREKQKTWGRKRKERVRRASVSLTNEQKAQLAQQKSGRSAQPSTTSAADAEVNAEKERLDREKLQVMEQELAEARAVQAEKKKVQDSANDDFVRRKLAEAAEAEAAKKKASEPDFMRIVQSEIEPNLKRITDADMIVIGKNLSEENDEEKNNNDDDDDDDDEMSEANEEERATYMLEMERIRALQNAAITGSSDQSEQEEEKKVVDVDVIISEEEANEQDEAEAVRKEAERIRMQSLEIAKNVVIDVAMNNEREEAEKEAAVLALEARIREKEEKLRLAKQKKIEEKEAEDKAQRMEKLLAEKERLRKERLEIELEEEKEKERMRLNSEREAESQREESLERKRAEKEAEHQRQLKVAQENEEAEILRMEQEIIRQKAEVLERQRLEQEMKQEAENAAAEKQRHEDEEKRLIEEERLECEREAEREREERDENEQQQMRMLEKQRSEALTKVEEDMKARRSRRADSAAENAKAPLGFAPIVSKRVGFLAVRLCEDCGTEGGVSGFCVDCGGAIVEVEVEEKVVAGDSDDDDDNDSNAVLKVCIECGEEGGDENFCEMCGGDMIALDGADLDDTMVMSPTGTLSMDFALIEEEEKSLRSSSRARALFDKGLTERSYEATEKDVFVVELCSDVIRFGWSSDSYPVTHLLPHSSKTPVFNSRLMDNVTDNDALVDVLKKVFRAGAYKKKNPVIFTSSLPTRSETNANLLDLLADDDGIVTKKVPSRFCFGTSPVFSAFRPNDIHPVALVIHLDYSNLSIVPVYYGISMEHARRFDVGMMDLLHYVALLSGFSFGKNIDELRSIASQLKVAPDFGVAMETRGYERAEIDEKQAIQGWVCKDPRKDSRENFGSLRVGVGMIAASEMLFQPGLAANCALTESLDVIVASVLAQCHAPELANRIVLSGFAGEIKGLKERLAAKLGDSVKLESVAAASAWLGAKALALDKNFNRYSVTPEEAEVMWLKYRFMQ